MFEHLGGYDVVLVTGPQRSGTQITARMIAHDTPLWYMDESEFRAADVRVWRSIVESVAMNVVEIGPQVIQCPGMCRFVHEYGDRDDLAVVLVRRPVEDIIASQKRIGWRYESVELANYGLKPRSSMTFGTTIAEVKYDFWDNHQKGLIRHCYEVEYESLAVHPLWVPADERRLFMPKQWQRS